MTGPSPSTDAEATTPSFADLGVSGDVVEALAAAGITQPFPIQIATIEAGLAGRDLCGKAPTGSGKTLAFGIPTIDLSNRGTPWRPAALILSPTRELATQIKDELEPLAAAKDRSILTVYGGTNIERDIKRLEKGIDILVACPGRLEDLISRRCCELRNVEIVVVDEADRMADMGFLPSVKRILDQTPDNRHTMLFSATLDGDVDTLITRYQHDPLTFEVDEQVGDIGDVEHSWYLIEPADRVSSAVEVLKRYESSIVFCRTRRGCDRVARNFSKRGLATVAIHGDLSQNQRERALGDFTSGKAQVLVATDVAARGIHVDDVALVMHYDPAGSDKDYIHRSGRTGRAGQNGRVISMVVEDKKKLARQLQKDLGMKPGFAVLQLDNLGDVVEHVAPPAPATSSPRNRDGRAERDDRDDRRGNNRGRGNRARGNRGRNRDDRDGGSAGRGGGSGRTGRDATGGGEGRSRDDRGGGGRRTGGGTGGGDSETSAKRTRRRRRGKNDWYPPGYHDDERSDRSGRRSRDDDSGGGNARGGKKRGSKPETGPSGGRNTTPRKSRAAKGRHADQSSTKNKGKRRNPRSR